ncbi:MAG: hypothetical protein FWE23_01970 [Chitinivibrionia bacterium]|nr:hypothetical protein [Chitinivibrionia bacterium]
MNLQNIIPQTTLHKIANLAQMPQEEGGNTAKVQEQNTTKPQLPQTPQESQAAQPAQTQTPKTADTALLSSPQNKEEMMQLLSKILAKTQGGEGMDATIKSVSVEKLASIAQTAVKNAENFAKLAQELTAQIEKSNLSPEEKELARAILKEVEAILRKPSPNSQLLQNANALPKNISTEEIFKWTATQVKAGNLSARDFFAVSQFLLGNETISNGEKTFTQNANTNVGAGFKPAQMQNQTHIAENQTVANYNRAGLKPAPTQNDKIPVFIKQTEANIRANIQNLIPLTQSEGIKSLLTEILSSPQRDNATFSFAKIEGKIGGGETKFLPLVLHTQFNSEFSAVLQKNFPEFSKELISDTANIIRTSPKPIILSQEVIENLRSILKSFTENTARPENTTQTESVIRPQNAQNLNTVQTTNAPAMPIPQFIQNAIPTPTETQNVSTPFLQNTANPIQTPQQILQTAGGSAASAATMWRITPSVLSALLQYIAEPSKNDAILQNFKTLFATEKSVENITAQMREFIKSKPDILLKELMQVNSEAITTRIAAHNKPEISSPQIWGQMQNTLEKLDNIENILKNPDIIFKKENPVDFLMAKIGILQGAIKQEELLRREKQPQMEENLRNVLREISSQIKEAAQKLQNLPNLQADEKLSEAFSRLRLLSNSVNELSQKIDSANLLANKVDITTGRSEQTVLIPVQIGNAWIQMELRINKDEKDGQEKKGKKQANEVELTVELEKGNTVSAKANLTLEKQLQVAINFTNEKMLEYFKLNYNEFYKALESIGTKSVRVSFNKKIEEEQKVQSAGIKSNIDITG